MHVTGLTYIGSKFDYPVDAILLHIRESAGMRAVRVTSKHE